MGASSGPGDGSSLRSRCYPRLNGSKAGASGPRDVSKDDVLGTAQPCHNQEKALAEAIPLPGFTGNPELFSSEGSTREHNHISPTNPRKALITPKRSMQRCSHRSRISLGHMWTETSRPPTGRSGLKPAVKEETAAPAREVVQQTFGW